LAKQVWRAARGSVFLGDEVLFEGVFVGFGGGEAFVEFGAEFTVEFLEVFDVDFNDGAGGNFVFFAFGGHHAHEDGGIFVGVFQNMLLAGFDAEQIAFAENASGGIVFGDDADGFGDWIDVLRVGKGSGEVRKDGLAGFFRLLGEGLLFSDRDFDLGPQRFLGVVVDGCGVRVFACVGLLAFGPRGTFFGIPGAKFRFRRGGPGFGDFGLISGVLGGFSGFLRFLTCEASFLVGLSGAHARGEAIGDISGDQKVGDPIGRRGINGGGSREGWGSREGSNL
jgi:hypothetical protein